jgi:hypothetical protein
LRAFQTSFDFAQRQRWLFWHRFCVRMLEFHYFLEISVGGRPTYMSKVILSLSKTMDEIGGAFDVAARTLLKKMDKSDAKAVPLLIAQCWVCERDIPTGCKITMEPRLMGLAQDETPKTLCLECAGYYCTPPFVLLKNQ